MTEYKFFFWWLMTLAITLVIGMWQVSTAITQLHEHAGPVPQYDCYEFYGDYPTEEEREQYRREYRQQYVMPEGADQGMPGPMLECDPADHTCID